VGSELVTQIEIEPEIKTKVEATMQNRGALFFGVPAPQIYRALASVTSPTAETSTWILHMVTFRAISLVGPKAPRSEAKERFISRQ
jgi:hypothetical protein